MNESQPALYLAGAFCIVENHGGKKGMYSIIVIDCQTKTEKLSCTDCIAHRTCRMLDSEKSKTEESLQMYVEQPKLMQASAYFAHI